MASLLLPTHRFELKIQNITEGSFTEVSGLSDEVEVESIPDGGQNTFLLQTPTRVRHQRLVLKRGMINFELRRWYEAFVKEQTIDRRNIDVFQLNVTGERRYQWSFSSALPVKWVGPSFNAGSSAVAFESIEFVHLGMEVLAL